MLKDYAAYEVYERKLFLLFQNYFQNYDFLSRLVSIYLESHAPKANTNLFNTGFHFALDLY